MFIVLMAFLIGIVCGLRALAGIAVLSWAARLHAIDLEGSKLAFLGYQFTPWIFTLAAIGELVNDKLPKTPSRLIPPQFITRVLMGALCGAVVGTAAHTLASGLIAGVVGSIAGTLGGAKMRALLAHFLRADLPAALLEDAVAIVLAIVVARSLGV